MLLFTLVHLCHDILVLWHDRTCNCAAERYGQGGHGKTKRSLVACALTYALAYFYSGLFLRTCALAYWCMPSCRRRLCPLSWLPARPRLQSCRQPWTCTAQKHAHSTLGEASVIRRWGPIMPFTPSASKLVAPFATHKDAQSIREVRLA